MSSTPYSAYLESAVVNAEPIELVRRLYTAAIDAVNEGRACLAGGKIRERTNAISKASNILRELSAAINPAPDPAMARNLLEIYDYMQRRLTEGHLQQSEKPLAEVARLLANLAEAWYQIDPHAS